MRHSLRPRFCNAKVRCLTWLRPRRLGLSRPHGFTSEAYWFDTSHSVDDHCKRQGGSNGWSVEPLRWRTLVIFEVLLLVLIAVIVIPPERLPEVVRTAGKVLRELRLASNTVVRELTSSFDDLPPPVMRPQAPAPPVRVPSADPEAPK